MRNNFNTRANFGEEKMTNITSDIKREEEEAEGTFLVLMEEKLIITLFAMTTHILFFFNLS